MFFPQNEHFSLPLRVLQVTEKKNESTEILEQAFYKQTQELIFKRHGEGYLIQQEVIWDQLVLTGPHTQDQDSI